MMNMNPFDTNPTFNLKVALQETGIKADTLRAWERRYGLPMPARTPGGHRLYSQYDLETIKWLQARQSEGMSISKAVKLWHSLKQEGTEPLTAAEYATTAKTTIPSIPTGAPITNIRQAWIDACMNFDEGAAEQVLSQAFAMYPAQMVVLEILQKGLAQVGDGWYENKATVQQEHFASGLAMRRLHALAAAAPAPTRPGKILIGCPPDERHTFPPLLLTLLLRLQGWEALYLGADVPIAEMAETVTAVSPKLVILTAQQIHTAANLLHMARFLARIGVPLAYGGRIFNLLPSLRKMIPGHFLGDTMETAVQTAVNTATYEMPTPQPSPVPPHFTDLAADFRRHQNSIENQVWARLKLNGIPYDHIANANAFLAQDLIASLTFGNVTLLDENIAWVETLLAHHQLPPYALKNYLETYHQAVKTEMDTSGQPIADWLAATSQKLSG